MPGRKRARKAKQPDADADVDVEGHQAPARITATLSQEAFARLQAEVKRRARREGYRQPYGAICSELILKYLKKT